MSDPSALGPECWALIAGHGSPHPHPRTSGGRGQGEQGGTGQGQCSGALHGALARGWVAVRMQLCTAKLCNLEPVTPPLWASVSPSLQEGAVSSDIQGPTVPVAEDSTYPQKPSFLSFSPEMVCQPHCRTGMTTWSWSPHQETLG